MSPAAAFAKVDIFLLFWRLTLPPNPFIIETDFIRGFIIMNFKTILKVISAIVAIAGVAVAVYLAIQKLTAPKEADICCHKKPPSLVGREHALCKRTGLEQGEAQKNRVSHDTPDRSDNVLAESDRLHQHRIDADADHNQEPLEPDCKE